MPISCSTADGAYWRATRFFSQAQGFSFMASTAFPVTRGSPRLGDRTTLLKLLELSWLFAFPALASLVCWLPNPDSRSSTRRWFSHAMFFIWLVVTAGHLGGVGFVYDFHWRLPLLAPTVWVLAWALSCRIGCFAGNSLEALQRQSLFGPLVATLI